MGACSACKIIADLIILSANHCPPHPRCHRSLEGVRHGLGVGEASRLETGSRVNPLWQFIESGKEGWLLAPGAPPH